MHRPTLTRRITDALLEALAAAVIVGGTIYIFLFNLPFYAG